MRATVYKSLCGSVAIYATLVGTEFDFLHLDPCKLEKYTVGQIRGESAS